MAAGNGVARIVCVFIPLLLGLYKPIFCLLVVFFALHAPNFTTKRSVVKGWSHAVANQKKDSKRGLSTEAHIPLAGYSSRILRA